MTFTLRLTKCLDLPVYMYRLDKFCPKSLAGKNAEYQKSSFSSKKKKKNPSPRKRSQYQPLVSTVFLWWGWQKAELPKQLCKSWFISHSHLFLPIKTFQKASGVNRKIQLAKPSPGALTCQVFRQAIPLQETETLVRLLDRSDVVKRCSNLLSWWLSQ